MFLIKIGKTINLEECPTTHHWTLSLVQFQDGLEQEQAEDECFGESENESRRAGDRAGSHSAESDAVESKDLSKRGTVPAERVSWLRIWRPRASRPSSGKAREADAIARSTGTVRPPLGLRVDAPGAAAGQDPGDVAGTDREGRVGSARFLFLSQRTDESDGPRQGAMSNDAASDADTTSSSHGEGNDHIHPARVVTEVPGVLGRIDAGDDEDQEALRWVPSQLRRVTCGLRGVGEPQRVLEHTEGNSDRHQSTPRSRTTSIPSQRPSRHRISTTR